MTSRDIPVERAGATKQKRGYLFWTVVLVFLMVGKVADWVPGLSSIPLVKIAYLLAAVPTFLGSGASLPPVSIRSSRIISAGCWDAIRATKSEKQLNR